jgi:hypothetical protein
MTHHQKERQKESKENPTKERQKESQGTQEKESLK